MKTPRTAFGFAVIALTAASGTARQGPPPRPPQLSPSPLPRPDGPAYARGFIHDVSVVYRNGTEHAENVDLSLLGSGRMLLAFRGGGTGQVETPDARIRVFAFDPVTYRGTLLSEVGAAPAMPARGIRDPKLLDWDGKLLLSAISRQAGFPIRDLFANARTVIAESADGGASFSTPAAAAFRGTPDATFGIWRYAARVHREGGRVVRTMYATGYNDGDLEAAYFTTTDGGRSFTRLGSIVNDAAEVPSEAELFFVGPNQETAVALVRLDNRGLLSGGQTAVCTKRAGPEGLSGDFECGRRLDSRLDGPSAVFTVDGRRFVAARKHLACTRKRTALYELRGDLADPRAAVSLCEIAELPSSGDTAYAAVAPIPGRDREYVLAWYSTPAGSDPPWLPAQLAPTSILAAQLDFKKYDPSSCRPPEPTPACPPPILPPSSRSTLAGAYVLGLTPSFVPERPAFFVAQARTQGERIDVSLQALDQRRLASGGDRVPIGERFDASGAIRPDGSFTVDFGNPQVPLAVWPIGGGLPGSFTFEGLRLTGVTTSPDAFCGGVEGDVVIAPLAGIVPPGTRLLLEGSRFGASRAGGVAACP